LNNLLKIAIAQTTPIYKDALKNFELIYPRLEALAKKNEVILLPELFLTGPITKEKIGQEPKIVKDNLVVLERLKELSKNCRCHIIAGLLEKKDDSLYNSLFLISFDGSVDVYRKMHLFTPFKEDKIFKRGELPPVFKIKNQEDNEVLLGLAICFDIRFPELFRYYVRHGAQIIFIASCWPQKRLEHLRLLLKARAIENQCFIVCANLCGKINNEVFAGFSSVITPAGDRILELDDKEGVGAICCDLSLVEKVRELFKSFYSFSNFHQRPCFKVISLEKAKDLCILRKRLGQKCVFTNGCFDILHAGHVDYLRKARECGDFLVVGLNSDKSVKDIKGDLRPVNTELDRAFVLASLSFVDYVVIFDDPTPINLINTIRPDVLVKGADWQEDEIVGAKEVKSWGGQVKRIPLLEGRSTSCIIERIVSRFKDKSNI